MKRWLTALIGMVFAMMAALAAPTTLAAPPARAFVLGVENHDYLPAYGIINGQYRGFARDLFDAYAKDRDIVFEYRALPVPRLYASFFGGQVDFKFPDNARWKEDQRTGKEIGYSAPVLTYIDGVVVPVDRKHVAAGEIRTLGTVAGFTPWAWKDRIDAGTVRVSENASFESLVRQVVTRRIDGAYANVAVVNYQLNEVLKMPGALAFAPQLPYSRDHYHLSSLKHAAVIRDFDQWLKHNSGLVDSLKKRHAVEVSLPPKP